MDLNALTISKEKFSLLVDNTNVASDPVIASALIKKKMICELMLKEQVTKIQFLKCLLSREINLHRSPKFSISRRHFEQVLNARPLSVTPFRPRDFFPSKRFCTRSHG